MLTWLASAVVDDVALAMKRAEEVGLITKLNDLRRMSVAGVHLSQIKLSFIERYKSGRIGPLSRPSRAQQGSLIGN